MNSTMHAVDTRHVFFRFNTVAAYTQGGIGAIKTLNYFAPRWPRIGGNAVTWPSRPAAARTSKVRKSEINGGRPNTHW